MDPRETPSSIGASNFSEEFTAEQLPIGWPWRLVVAMAIILGLTIFAYVGLKAGYETSLTRRSEAADQQIGTLTEQVSADDRDKFMTFYSQVANLKTVLQKHVFGSNAFTFLERNSLPTLYYMEAELRVADRTLALKGAADSFDTVAGEMGILGKRPEVAGVDLKKVDLQGGATTFTLEVRFDPSFFDTPTF